MPKKTYTSLPADYADCPMAATCLHQLAYPTLLGSQTYLRLINPRKCSKDETCSFYRNSKHMTYLSELANG